MTLIGKFLAVLNLIVGIGMAIWATSLYTQRPTYFEPPPEGAVDKGNVVVTFKGMTAEIDALGKTATTATQNWGGALKSLKEMEKTRKERQAEYDRRIQVAWQGPVKAGSPQDLRAQGPAFYTDVRDERTGLIDITQVVTDKKGNPLPVYGPDGLVLQGADTLMDAHRKEVEAVHGDGKKNMGLLYEIKELREKQLMLQADIVKTEARVLKQFQIREEVQLEVLFLKDFRITVGSDQETVYARKKQLTERLRMVVPPKRD